MDFNKELWQQAQENAIISYEEEHGIGTWWIDTDKYEREDCVWAEYEKLKGESGNMQMRDSKGRFVSNNVNNKITNKNSNQKGNDTMKTNKDVRMETLKANGVNVDNFFNLNLQIPFGAEVKLSVDGKEMVIPATSAGILGTYKGRKIDLCKGDLVDSDTGEVLFMGIGKDDPIAQSIINDGYVKNNKLFRRWIFAQTMRLINYVNPKNPDRKGWEAGFKDLYDYNYQFKMLLEEMHVLAVLQKEDPEQFTERTYFFNGNVVVATLNDYLYRLKKYCKKQMREHPRKHKGQAYVKLARYGNVLVKNLDIKVYNHIIIGIDNVKAAVKIERYDIIEKRLREFMDECYNKLPYDTPKCAVFKDAFKGAGAFYSLQNAIRFHNVIINECYSKYESEDKLYQLLDNDFKGEVWRFHQLLVDTLEYNHFNLKQSIANGHAAPNTTSTRANVYNRG